MRRVVVVDRRGLFVNGLCMVLASSLPEHRIGCCAKMLNRRRKSSIGRTSRPGAHRPQLAKRLMPVLRLLRNDFLAPVLS